jgi:hypothetical protein
MGKEVWEYHKQNIYYFYGNYYLIGYGDCFAAKAARNDDPTTPVVASPKGVAIYYAGYCFVLLATTDFS